MTNLRPPKAEKKIVHVLDPSQVRKLLAKAEPGQEKTLLLAALKLGLRKSELFGLIWANVDFQANTILVECALAIDDDGSLRRMPPKNDYSVRKLPMPETVALALTDLRKSEPWRKPDDLIFHKPEGSPIRKDNYLKRVFYPLLAKAEVPQVIFHSLRHTANSVAIMGGGDVDSVAQRNGHRDGRMVTSTYAHVFAGASDRIAVIMDRLTETRIHHLKMMGVKLGVKRA